jgi:arylsulfatase A-like enzyme
VASESLRLTDFHVAPMCTPTRGQLMSGCDAFRNGATNVSSGRTLLRPELETIADVFHDDGYHTGIFGKWHLGDNYPFRPEDRGFEEALWFPSSHMNSVPDFWDNDYFDDTYIHNGRRTKVEGYCTDVFFREAMKWIERNTAESRPFFVYLPLNAAHWPWFVPDAYRQPVRDAMKQHSEVVEHLDAAQRESLVSFLAMGANIDDNVGRLDQFLKDNQLRDNTILVFLTDNGSTFGPRYFNAGMRGSKTTLWEGGHRVPCFIRWPAGELGPSREINTLSHVQDLLPTTAELAGIQNIPPQLDGISLAPIFRRENVPWPDRMLVINYSRMPMFKVTYTTGNPAIPQRDGAAVLWRHWRWLENRELYNVKTDPHQDHDVAADHPEVVAKMRSHLEAWWDRVDDRVMEPQRVIIGSDRENPMMLTACEWLDVFVDQQVQIRRGVRKNGAWHLNVQRAGTYLFELRRWPRESHLRLDATVDATPVTDGQYVEGVAIPIVSARIRIGQYSEESLPDEGQQSVSFKVPLQAGDAELQTWFLDKDRQELLGAYYVYVERI